MIAALCIIYLALPAFNHLTGKEITFDVLENGFFWLGLMGLVLFTGLVAGSYPAFYLSAFQPAPILKGKKVRGVGRFSLRKWLVVVQFFISIFLITGTIVVLNQLDYMKHQNLGFDKEQILVLRVKGRGVREQFASFKNALKQNPKILDVTTSTGIPGEVDYILSVYQEGKPMSEAHSYDIIYADYDFVSTYGMEIVRGRNFSKRFATDTAGVFLLNMTAAEKLGWGYDAVGRKIGFTEESMGPIVGLVSDFHYQSLHEAIGPLAIVLTDESESRVSIKLRPEEISEIISFVQKTWKTFEHERSFEYFFADEHFNTLYHGEERLSRIIMTFALLGIFIACLGLFGLASFTAEQRTKEIGIRKVLGAPVSGIVILLTKEFMRWILLANLAAWPIAYIVMNRWLQNFAYRTHIDWRTFVLATALGIVVAMLTVSYQSIKAAITNPVDSLKYE